MIKSAIYADEEGVKRQIAVIAGIPFYKSSGVSSGFGGTWLPFLGVADASAEGSYSASIVHGSYVHTEENPWVKDNLSAEMKHYFRETTGWLIKLESVFGIEEDEFFEEMMAFAPRRRRTILDRVARPILAVISAALSGGFWQTDLGEMVCKFLKEKYPIDAIKENLVIMDPEIIFDEGNFTAINEWLLMQGAVVNVMRKLQDRLSTGMPEGLDVSSGMPRTTLGDVYSFVEVEQQVLIISNLQKYAANDISCQAIYMPLSETELITDKMARELSDKYLFVPSVNESEASCVPVSVPNNMRSVTKVMAVMLQENLEELALSCEKRAKEDKEAEKIREAFAKISLYSSSIMAGFVDIGNKLADCEEKLEAVETRMSHLPPNKYKLSSK